MSYEDIITRKPKKVHVITDQNVRQTYRTPEYMPIVSALGHKYSTIKEIVVEYNKIVTANIEKMDIDREEKNKRIKQATRKDKTIYRYVKKMVEAGLVLAAGKRVKMGQIASETLYCRAGFIIHFKPDYKKLWDTEEYDVILDRIKLFVQKSDPALKVTKKSIKELILKIEEYYDVLYSSNLEKLVDEKSSFISGLSVRQSELLTELSQNILLMLNIDHFKNELENLR
ncbi:MAG: hypothetical protein FK733_07380 [Asgard group archaeon]|nr:hypothetical protein [Asgard group archaeon]